MDAPITKQKAEPGRVLQNYRAQPGGVKSRLKMLIYECKLRVIGDFCLPRLSLVTFCNTLQVAGYG